MEILIALLCIIGQIWIISDLPLAVKDKNKLLAGVFFLEFFILLGFHVNDHRARDQQAFDDQLVLRGNMQEV